MNNNNALVQFKTECLAKPEFKGVFQRMMKTGLAFLELQYKTAVALHEKPGTQISEPEAAAYLASKQAFHDAKFSLMETCTKARLAVPFFTIDEVPVLADSTTHE